MIAERHQLAAEKKLLKAEVASLKRQAAEQLATLRMLQKEYAQVAHSDDLRAQLKHLHTCRIRTSAWVQVHLFDICVKVELLELLFVKFRRANSFT